PRLGRRRGRAGQSARQLRPGRGRTILCGYRPGRKRRARPHAPRTHRQNPLPPGKRTVALPRAPPLAPTSAKAISTLTTPSEHSRRLAAPPPRKFHAGLDGWAHGVGGWWRRRPALQRSLLARAAAIDALGARYATINQADLQADLAAHRLVFRRGGRI